MNKLSNLEPKKVFYFFEELTKIPRCSLNEKKVSDFLVNFAKERNLEFQRDKENNVVIKKKATKGYENSPTVILQAHMDMVCVKKTECDFDFDKDAINFKVEGNKIIAHDTTLGADDGIGVAIALAILDSDDIEHPALEILLTTNEENGMSGAQNLDGSMLTGDILINIDSETEGVACIACAGGERDFLNFDKKTKSLNKTYEIYDLILTGLKGGHSGQLIIKGLGNANKLLARSLFEITSKFDIDLIDISGGSKPNSIPRYAKAIIAINPENRIDIQNIIVKLNKEFVIEIGKVDPDVRLNFEKSETENVDVALSDDLKENIINLLYILPNGVQSMSHNVKGLPACSVNIGVIQNEDNQIKILTNIRSELGSLKEEVSNQHKIMAELCNATFEIQSSYPAWEYKDKSKIRDISVHVYKEMFNKNLKLEAIHAGLECGLFKESIGDIDMISIGPDVNGAHAPGESIEIDSVGKVYDFIINVLKNIK